MPNSYENFDDAVEVITPEKKPSPQLTITVDNFQKIPQSGEQTPQSVRTVNIEDSPKSATPLLPPSTSTAPPPSPVPIVLPIYTNTFRQLFFNGFFPCDALFNCKREQQKKVKKTEAPSPKKMV